MSAQTASVLADPAVDAPLQIGFVVNFEPSDPPGRWLGEYLPEKGFVSSIVQAVPAPGSFLAKHRLPPYLDEFVHLMLRRPRLDGYDVLFTWELRNTMAAILLRRLGRRRRSHVVCLCPSLKGQLLRALPVVRYLLRDTTRIVAFSTAECDYLRTLLRLPAEHVVFVPRFAKAVPESTPSPETEAPFVMALGHSNRDFPTLWKAISGSEVRVVMYRNSYMQGRELPNVTAIPSMLSAADENELVGQAAFHVIPLKDASFSSGLTVLLRAMAHGKAVIVTDGTGISDYVRDGETAILVPPGDATALRAAMERLWHDRAERDRIGHNAAAAVRDQFDAPHFARHLADIAQSVTRPPDLIATNRRHFKEETCASL